jgi:hypothetical protein
MANDRPPIVGTVGRRSDQIRLKVSDNTQQATIQPQVEATTFPIIAKTDLYQFLEAALLDEVEAETNFRQWVRQQN